MRTLLLLLLLPLLALLTTPATWAGGETPSGAEGFAGAWEGTLAYGGEPLRLRLDVATGEDGALAATVDLPQLVYAGQAVAVELAEEGLRVELPFGLGTAALRRLDGSLVGRSELGEGKAVDVALAPAARFAPVVETVSFGEAPAVPGALVLPPGEGPFPLILLVAGASEPHRGNWSYASWTDLLARRGVASVIYDRRPDGATRADGSLYDLEDQARDLVAAVDLLARDQRIDTDRLGVFGKSRGAWIALAAASLDPRIDFLVASGGAAVGVAEQDLQMVEARMRGAGEPEASIQAALAYARLQFHVARHRESWDRLAAARDEAEAQPWSRYVRLPEAPGDLDWFAAHLDFDPMPLLADLDVPVFYAWGGEDRIVPPAVNRPLVEALVAPEVARRSRFRVYAGAGHSLEGPLNTDEDDDVVWSGVDAAFLADLWAWLEELGVVTARP